MLSRAVARQVRACLVDLPDASSTVRNEMLSIASTMRYLSSELEYGAQCAQTCEAFADRLRTQLQSVGLNLPSDVPAVLAAIASPTVASETQATVFRWLVQYLYDCNQAELGMYRQGQPSRGDKT